jgi:CDGSH-type Zn-finger protein/uncharacterized Fe-S cluster protein YjdI
MASKVLRYEGDEIVINYDVGRCIHAAECAEGLPEVFDPERKPWVDPDGARPHRIATVIHRCPSGALSYDRLDGEPNESAPEVNIVQVEEDGPLYVTGNIEIRTADGSSIAKETRVALCRCGLSSNKPFCDNSHRDGEFADEGYLGNGGIKLTPGLTDSVLTVTLSENGPILLAGEVRIEGSDGEERSGTRTALCRCGHSNNKPFCDGTHRAVSFVS